MRSTTNFIFEQMLNYSVQGLIYYNQMFAL